MLYIYYIYVCIYKAYLWPYENVLFDILYHSENLSL